ncbi:MAG: transposase, family, partial [Bradyrhizobium sp.]|nr:transposase, family [Bradyrhizobium sp.]
MKQFSECFEDLPDPRADNALHDLTELLFIALMATLCGATSCVDMALFARMKAYLWQDVLVLKHGFPSHDTFSRIFRMLDPEAFEVAFRRFMKAFAEGARIERPHG